MAFDPARSHVANLSTAIRGRGILPAVAAISLGDGHRTASLRRNTHAQDLALRNQLRRHRPGPDRPAGHELRMDEDARHAPTCRWSRHDPRPADLCWPEVHRAVVHLLVAHHLHNLVQALQAVARDDTIVPVGQGADPMARMARQRPALGWFGSNDPRVLVLLESAWLQDEHRALVAPMQGLLLNAWAPADLLKLARDHHAVLENDVEGRLLFLQVDGGRQAHPHLISGGLPHIVP
mmetsp:Transcript_28251/g.59828  ORF Transcript_28251/g.59828 Transcript_28251/m.59828 type:complete len:236 (-) Transcript_28251:707-1414(-)